MAGWGEGDFEMAVFEALPGVEFVDALEAESGDEFAYEFWDSDGLVGGDGFEAFFIKVVEVGVGDEDEVNGWDFVGGDGWEFEAFDDF